MAASDMGLSFTEIRDGVIKNRVQELFDSGMIEEGRYVAEWYQTNSESGEQTIIPEMASFFEQNKTSLAELRNQNPLTRTAEQWQIEFLCDDTKFSGLVEMDGHPHLLDSFIEIELNPYCEGYSESESDEAFARFAIALAQLSAFLDTFSSAH